MFHIQVCVGLRLCLITAITGIMEASVLALRSYQGWMYFAPLEVLGISRKFEEAVEVNCLGSKGDGGEDGYLMVFAMGPPP